VYRAIFDLSQIGRLVIRAIPFLFCSKARVNVEFAEGLKKEKNIVEKHETYRASVGIYVCMHTDTYTHTLLTRTVLDTQTYTHTNTPTQTYKTCVRARARITHAHKAPTPENWRKLATACKKF
jgi:hypothetical protein